LFIHLFRFLHDVLVIDDTSDPVVVVSHFYRHDGI
jgi:hypothetical protein